MTSKDLGRIFREARDKRGFSVREVASRSNIHDNVIKDIETGDFERLGKVYIKGFIKKYSAFLELDTDDMIQKFTDLSSSIEDRKFKVNAKDTAEIKAKKTAMKMPEFKIPEFTLPKFKIPKINIDFTPKQIQGIVVGVLSVVMIALLFLFIGMVRTRVSSPEKLKPASRTTSTAKKTVKTPPKKIVSQAPSKATGPVTLKIKAKGEVWLKVVEGDNQLFVGTLKSGESKTWNSKETISVWTGNAGNLDFTVNRKSLGTVAAGVVKNIRISSGGVRVGNEWVERLD